MEVDSNCERRTSATENVFCRIEITIMQGTAWHTDSSAPGADNTGCPTGPLGPLALAEGAVRHAHF